MKKLHLYQERFYRDFPAARGFARFEVRIRESDLLVLASLPRSAGHDRGGNTLESLAYRTLGRARSEIERYIERDCAFARALSPRAVPDGAPEVVQRMAQAAAAWGVGPMAAVAGAVAQEVGRALREVSSAVMVENGGDVFLSLPREATLRLYAGEDSPFKDNVLFKVPQSHRGLGVCTSSGRVGHSLSFGCADAVVVVARDGALADAAATAIANRVRSPGDVAPVVREVAREGGVMGLVVAAGGKIGLWGKVTLVKQEESDAAERSDFSLQAGDSR